MTIQQAIFKAIDSGFIYEVGSALPQKMSLEMDYKGDGVYVDSVLLNPLFWQSLGKAMGWVEVCDNPDHGFWTEGAYGCQLCGHNEDHIIESTRDNWKKEWHRFIDKLAEGGTAESFFEKL